MNVFRRTGSVAGLQKKVANTLALTVYVNVSRPISSWLRRKTCRCWCEILNASFSGPCRMQVSGADV